MLDVILLSFMKWTKDTHNSPPADATLDSLVAAAVDLGVTHCEVATVLGRPNWASESLRWSSRIHTAGKSVTWRCASDQMEGLYGVTHAVGVNRIAEQDYIDLAVNAILDNEDLFADGDEWAIYPERTEGIFSDATSWITPNTPSNYADFFDALGEACAAAFVTIGKDVAVNLQANNFSELNSGWMNGLIVTNAGFKVIDHYDDGDAAGLEASIRAVHAMYGGAAYPIYLQESAVHRFSTPTTLQITEYFGSIQSMVDDGVITRYGYWGGWTGTPESIFEADFSLNESGLALKAFIIANTVIETIPDAPTSLDAEANSPTSATITWVDNSINELGYTIERTTAPSGWVSAGEYDASAGATSKTFNDQNPGLTYRYRVKAFNEAGSSDWSEEASVTMPEHFIPTGGMGRKKRIVATFI